jgi:adenine phosphoribosyltransferase
VDDWVETGGQLTGARALVEQAGAAWCGAAVIVDGLRSVPPRRRLHVRALLHIRDL